MEVFSSNQYGPLPEARLAQFEAQIGYRLPEDYRRFLLEHNGGVPSPNCFTISAEQGNDVLVGFFGLHSGQSYLRIDEAVEMIDDRLFPGLLPIGTDPFGNCMCVGLVEPYRGRVYFWDHEVASELDVPGSKGVILVAESFQAFLDSMFAGRYGA